MKKIFIFALIALVSLSAFAQSQSSDRKVVRTSDLQLNGFADNWFAGAAAGVNGVVDNGTATFQGVAVDAYVGKWFTPRTGLRIGWHGVDNRNLADEWLYGDHRFAYNYLHADVLLRVTNLVKYNPDRIFDLDLVAGAGTVFTNYMVSNWEFAGGFGLIGNFRIWKNLKATVEGEFILAKSAAWRTSGNIIGFPSFTAGLAYDFGRKTRWEPKETTVITNTVERVVRDDSREKELLAQLDSLRTHARKDTVTIYAEGETIPQIVYFDLDKDFLTQRESAHLEYLAWNLPAGYRVSFTLYGSADKPTGNPVHNMGLSKRRCETVRKALEGFGYTDITCVPEGDTNNRFEGMPKNRCVIIAITLTKE